MCAVPRRVLPNGRYRTSYRRRTSTRDLVSDPGGCFVVTSECDHYHQRTFHKVSSAVSRRAHVEQFIPQKISQDSSPPHVSQGGKPTTMMGDTPMERTRAEAFEKTSARGGGDQKPPPSVPFNDWARCPSRRRREDLLFPPSSCRNAASASGTRLLIILRYACDAVMCRPAAQGKWACLHLAQPVLGACLGHGGAWLE